MNEMRTYDQLERLWLDTPPPARGGGTVRLICIRTRPGEHACPDRVSLSAGGGVEGDRWSAKEGANPEYQVTLMSVRAAELVAADHAPLHQAGDNFLVDLDLAEEALPAGARLRLGEALLEVSARPHLGCKKFGERFGEDALRWVNDPAHRARRLRGVNCRVIEGGTVSLGDAIHAVDRG